MCVTMFYPFFFLNDTPTTEIYPLTLHDALPILLLSRNVESEDLLLDRTDCPANAGSHQCLEQGLLGRHVRSEEHTSELQSRQYLVCRLLLEKKKKRTDYINYNIASCLIT